MKENDERGDNNDKRHQRNNSQILVSFAFGLVSERDRRKKARKGRKRRQRTSKGKQGSARRRLDQ